MSNEVNYIKPNGLFYTVSWMNATQQELTGQFNKEFSLEILKELDKAGFFYNPELTFGDNPEIINIVNEAGKKILGFEDLSLARIMARELSFEGVHIPAK